MVEIEVTRASDGCLAGLTMTGHVSLAGGPRGGNVICAAVTGLVRSCVEVVAGAPGIAAFGAAEREGELRVTVGSVEDGQRDWLRGVTDVLVSGVRRMATDAPGEVGLTEVAVAPSPERTKEQ